MRFCLFIHFFQCCFFRFCSYTLKFERATTWWISWKRCSLFLPILRKLLSNVPCMWSDVGGTQHETIYLLIIKCIYFMNSYLECTVLVFFLIKSENSLMHGLFHNCSFMHKLLVISCTGTCPVCAVNMSVHLMTAFPLRLSVTNSWTVCRFLAWIYYEQ